MIKHELIELILFCLSQRFLKHCWCFSSSSLHVLLSLIYSGLFGKAKRKFLGKELETSSDFTGVEGLSLADPSSASSSSNVGGIDPTLWEPQEIGKLVTTSIQT